MLLCVGTFFIYFSVTFIGGAVHCWGVSINWADRGSDVRKKLFFSFKFLFWLYLPLNIVIPCHEILFLFRSEHPVSNIYFTVWFVQRILNWPYTPWSQLLIKRFLALFYYWNFESTLISTLQLSLIILVVIVLLNFVGFSFGHIVLPFAPGLLWKIDINIECIFNLWKYISIG